MKQQLFEQRYGDSWQQLEQSLAASPITVGSDFPRHYRALCQQLAVAKARRYSPQLLERLNKLVIACHQYLYGFETGQRQRLLHFLFFGFPQLLRANRRYVAVAALLFVLPLLAMALGCYFHSELIYSLMSAEQVRQFEAMYDPANRVLGRERGADTDLMMFGHYINNNIGIGFRTFAGGILLGLGSLLLLVFNGLAIGGAAGYLTQLGFSETFYAFVVGHGAFELTAIVFCGAAGLKLGFALVDPGPWRRLDALRLAGAEAVQIVYGSALMLLLAAFIEAFWSSSTEIPLPIKYGVAALLALLLLLYCCSAAFHSASVSSRRPR